jgi:hypothetical protein
MRDEFTKLLDRWQKKTGEQMPRSISRLSLDLIRKAVELTEAGNHVIVPVAPISAKVIEHDSITNWDKHGEFG